MNIIENKFVPQYDKVDKYCYKKDEEKELDRNIRGS